MEKIVNIRALGANIKYFREEKHLTANKLAEMTDVSVSHINNIESASVNASAKVLIQIAHALEVPLDVLLCDSMTGKANRMARIMEYECLLEDCDEYESKIITGTVREMKKLLREGRQNRQNGLPFWQKRGIIKEVVNSQEEKDENCDM